jgi:hypothetical protein
MIILFRVLKQRLISKILSFYNLFLARQVIKKILEDKPAKVSVFDIDNTIADTWPSLLNANLFDQKSEVKRYLSLPILSSFYPIIKSIVSKDDTTILFLSARSSNMYLVTKEWLKDKQLWNNRANLIIVQTPNDKLKYLSELSLKISNVEYYDDLSYNHENGEVLFYSSVIEKVKKMNIHYYDYSYINNPTNKY